MVAPGEVEAKGGRVLKPSGAQAEEMGAADIQQFSSGVGVELALIEGVQGLLEERQGEALEELVFCTGPLDAGGVRMARLFVGLRYAPASSKPGHADESFLPCRAGVYFSLILFPQRSHFVPAPTAF